MVAASTHAHRTREQPSAFVIVVSCHARGLPPLVGSYAWARATHAQGPAAGKVVPWYSVYGNHDVSQKDLDCGCRSDTQKCNQVKRHGFQPGPNLSWYMPDVSFHVRPLAGLPTELVALDLNARDAVKLCPWVACNREECESPDDQFYEDGCLLSECTQTLLDREVEAAQLLRERVEAAVSEQRQHLLVFSHYPVDYLRGVTAGGVNILHTLRDKRLRVAYFGGHRHGTENNTNEATLPFHAFTLGGGGGWSCDGAQGYLVGEIMSDGSWDHLKLVTIPFEDCCGPYTPIEVFATGCKEMGSCRKYDCTINGNCER